MVSLSNVWLLGLWVPHTGNLALSTRLLISLQRGGFHYGLERLRKFFFFFYIICMCVSTCVSIAQKSEESIGSLELELQMAEGHHVGAARAVGALNS